VVSFAPMPPRDHRSISQDAPRISRSVSASNSIASSLPPLDADPNNKNKTTSTSGTQANNRRINWSEIVPIVGTTILTWALQANARVRKHASACCTGDFCVVDSAGEMIPEEIVFQCKRPKTNSKAAGNPNDIELEDFSVTDSEVLENTSPEYEAPWTIPLPIRRTKWNEIPEDPVDEVSLKGSSAYLSSSDDEDYDFHRKEIEAELQRTKRR
jgi:hypothetical protein